MLFYPALCCLFYLETFLWLTQVKKVKPNTQTQKLWRGGFKCVKEAQTWSWETWVLVPVLSRDSLLSGAGGFTSEPLAASAKGKQWHLCPLPCSICTRSAGEIAKTVPDSSGGFVIFKTLRFVFCLVVGQSQKYRRVRVATRTARSWKGLDPREGNLGGAERNGVF